MKIEVTKLQHVNKGSLKGFASVTLGGFLELRDMRILQTEGRDPFVTPASKEFTGRDGKRAWSDIYRVLDDELKGRIESVILMACKADGWFGPCSEDEPEQEELITADDIPF